MSKQVPRMAAKQRSHLKPKRGTYSREPFSHFTKNGQPKVSFLSIESAQRRAAELGGLDVYRCNEYGCIHIGKSTGGLPSLTPPSTT